MLYICFISGFFPYQQNSLKKCLHINGQKSTFLTTYCKCFQLNINQIDQTNKVDKKYIQVMSSLVNFFTIIIIKNINTKPS